MFERLRHPSKPLIAMLIFSVALAGCTQKTEAEPYYDDHNYSAPASPSKSPAPPSVYPDGVAMNGLKACFTVPPQQVRRAENDTWDAGSRIVLQPNPETDSVVGDPGPLSPLVEKKVRGAIVEVKDEGETGGGSGFLVEPDVVVTAGHVPDSPNISVTDSKGKTAKVIGGCYLHQDAGVPVDLTSGRTVSLDIAILKLDHRIGSSVLKIASAPAERGSWVTLANAQGAFTAQNPAIYNGIALTGNDHEKGASVLTGITRCGSDNFETYTSIGGASGGLALNNANGEVVGMTYASFGGQRSDLIDNMLVLDYGVLTPSRTDNPNLLEDQAKFGWYMNPTRIVTPDFINLALSSPNY